jgi:mRNA interferase RelE/StbE
LVWQIKFEAAATKDLAKPDKAVANRITSFLRDRVLSLDDPRGIGEALRGPRLGEFWKYRVGDYRIICAIEDGELIVLVVRIGNRREVYR